VILRACLACGTLLLGGCGLLGKPEPLSADAPLTMTVSIPGLEGNLLPARYTCHGRGENPPVFWSGAPSSTKSFAVVVDDSDAPITPRVYWLVFNIGPSTSDLETGQLPPYTKVAYNSAGAPKYEPLCPTHSSHKYRISVYALNTYFSGALLKNPQLLATWTSIARHVIARGTMDVRVQP